MFQSRLAHCDDEALVSSFKDLDWQKIFFALFANTIKVVVCLHSSVEAGVVVVARFAADTLCFEREGERGGRVRERERERVRERERERCRQTTTKYQGRPSCKKLFFSLLS